jgi:hypothetical protein
VAGDQRLHRDVAMSYCLAQSCVGFAHRVDGFYPLSRRLLSSRLAVPGGGAKLALAGHYFKSDAPSERAKKILPWVRRDE